MKKTIYIILSTIALNLISSFIYSKIEQQTFLDSIIIVSKWILTTLLSVLTFNIPFWIIISLIVFFLIGFKIFKSLNKTSTTTSHKPTSHIIGNVCWRWRWYGNQFIDLTPFCLNDETPIIENHSFYSSHSHYCPSCKTNFELDKREAEAIILGHLNRELFRLK